MELLRPLSDAEYPAQTISATSGSATASSAWQPGAQGVVVWATVPCYITVGTDTSLAATSSSTPVPANVPIPFYVSQQTTSRPFKVSALAVSTSGTVYCKPINIR